jgi:hypothetical protein
LTAKTPKTNDDYQLWDGEEDEEQQVTIPEKINNVLTNILTDLPCG